VLANIDANPSIPLTSVFDDVVVRVSNATHVMLVFLIVFFALRLDLDGLLFPTVRRTAIYLAVIFAPSIWDAFQFTSAKAAVGFIFLAFFWHF
jgi:solute carrier family 38 (sodium-coupled neutral amino acid transporter), member 2